MSIARKGTIARPGVHKNIFTGEDEVVTWEMLKEAVRFQGDIPLVSEHPLTGYINPDDRFGTAKQIINERDKIIEGSFTFFDDKWNLIPPKIRQDILRYKKIPLSVGYTPGPIVNGEQTSRQYDHIALGVKDPMMDGVGVRVESRLPDNFRIESDHEIEEQETSPVDGFIFEGDTDKTEYTVAKTAKQKKRSEGVEAPDEDGFFTFEMRNK